MKRSTKKSLYKIFVSLFVIFYTFLPQSIVIGQVINEISQENAAPIEDIPQENAVPTVVDEISEETLPDEEVVPIDEASQIIKEAMNFPVWEINGNSATTFDVVQLGKTYISPQNSRVRVTFTKLPENPSKLTITEIILTQEEIDATNAVSNIAYDITTDMIDGTFEYDLVLPSIKEGARVVFAENRDSILSDLKEVDNEIVNENNSIEIKNLDHFTLFIVTNPGPKLSTAMVNGMSYVSVPPNTSVTVSLQVTTSGSDNDWKTTKYQIGSGGWACANTTDHLSSGTYTETFSVSAPSVLGSYNLYLIAYSGENCTGSESNEVTLTDAIRVVTSSPSLTPPTLTDNPSDPISLTSVSGIWTNIIGGSGHQGEGTNEIRWGTPAGNYKSGLKFTNSGNQSFNTGNTFYLGMLTHMNWPTNSGTAATGAKLQITLNFNRPDIADAVFLYDFSIEETPNSKGNCPIYQRTLTACDDKVTFPNSYGTTVFTIGDIIYTLVIDGFVDAYPTGTAVDAFITEEEKDNSAFLVGHLSSVLVEKPQITLTKKVNDKDVSAAPGPNLYIGDSVTWQYIVQNTGNVDLTNVTVVDNPSANIDCDPLTEGNQNSGLTLASGASMTCEATGTVVQGQFSNTATVTGTPPNGVNVTDSDSSWYYGIWKPGHIIVQKTTIPAADPTSFTIEATGSGTITGGGIGTVTDSTDKDYEVTPGTYSVTETVPTGWSLTSNDCTNINVAAGETKYCTITNAKNGSITIIKDAKPDSTQSFSFTASQEMGSSSFTLYGVTNDATHPNTRTFSNLPAGAYTVKELPDEDNVGGDWVLTSLTCVDPTGNSSADTTNPYQANINLAAGEAVTCTFTNMMLPKLTITKTVINHGLSYGTDHFSPYKVGTTVVTLNQATSFNPGTYTVSETEDSNYTVTFGGDCDSHGSVTLVAGDNKTCTITNEEKLTYLTLVKTVTNDNGGKALATEWTLTATGPTNISGKTGDASITNVAVNSGVYTLSESGGPSGYTMGNWSCTGGSLSGNQITLSSGQSATCTLTNNDQAGTLIVKKVVVNDDGGKLGAEDFTFKIGDGDPVSFEADGQNDITINAGTYTITEPAVSGYTTTYDNCSGVVVVNGGTQTCTITNDDIAPGLTVIKNVVNDNGGNAVVGDFDIKLDGTELSFGAGVVDGTTTTYTSNPTVVSNYEYTLSEIDFGGYTEGTWDCGTLDGLTTKFTLNEGQNITCTITNDDIAPGLTVIKNVVNDNGGNAVVGDFDIKLDGTELSFGAGVVDGTTTTYTSNPTVVSNYEYTLSEIDFGGYTEGTWDCGTLDGLTTKFTLNEGQNITCTITNDDIAPGLTVIKNVVNDNGGNAVVGDFDIKLDGTELSFGAGVVDGTTTTYTSNPTVVSNYEYTLSEIDFGGYTEGTWDCGTLDGLTTKFTLNEGQNITCTITNDDIAPGLTVIKNVVNDNGGNAVVGDFDIKLDGTELSFGAGVVDGTTTTYTSNPTVVSNYEYTLSEIDFGGYTEGTWDCGTLDGLTTKFTLNEGQNITCTITNDDIAPGLTVIKKVVNDNGGNAVVGDFDIKLDGTELSFGAGVVDGTTTTYTSNPTVVSNYEYTLSEIDFGGYTEGTWDCGTLDGLTTKFTLNEGQNITCTITNDDIAPGLTVIKNVVNDNGGNAVVGDFDIKLDGTELSFGAGVVDGTTTTYTSNPTVVSNYEYTLSEIDFGGYTEGTWDCGTLDGLTTKFTLNEGQNITCTITNDDQSGSITIKKDVANYLGVYEDIYSSSIFSVYLNEDPLTAKDISDEVVNPSIATYIDMDAGDYSLNEVVTDGYSLEGCYIISDETAELIEDNQFRLNNGQDLEIVCKNMEIEPQLKITKDNNSPIDGLLSGSTVLYTIIVTAPSNEEEETYLINNVKVTDILPKGFEYMSGTWTANSSVRGNIKGSITTEPEYNEGLATWNLGDMKEGEIVTLTYTAKINLLNEPGTYKDIAFVQGDSLLAEKDSGDVLGISYDPSEYLHTDTLGDNFVGTKVLVIEPMEEGGEVLGASTTLTLPKTGAETYITLGAIISMILGILLLVFGKKRKLNTILLSTVLLFGIFTLVKPIQTYAQVSGTKVSVRLEQPKTGLTDREFNVTYVALSIPVKPITVQCQYSLDGVNFSNFDISKTTNSGDCKVDQSIVTGSGTYYFKAVATVEGVSPVESEVVSVNITDNPSPVTEYSKTKTACIYTLKFKSSTSKVQIFRSDNQKSFYADDTTLITKPYLTVTPNVLSTYTDTPADCSKEYYYAVRAVDEYSNVSALVTDNVVTVVEQTQTSTSQESEEVAGEETTTQQEQETTSTGEVAGEETTAQQEEKAETDTKEETETEEEETKESIWDKYKYLIISVIVVVLGSGIYDYIRRKK